MGTAELLVVLPPLKYASAVYVTPSTVSVPPPTLIARTRVNPLLELVELLDELELVVVLPVELELLEEELLDELEELDVFAIATLSVVDAKVNRANRGNATELVVLRSSIIIVPVLGIPAIVRVIALLRAPAANKIS
jgi:hypothetical protein